MDLRAVFLLHGLPELRQELHGSIPCPDRICRDDLAVLRRAAGSKPGIQIVQLRAEGIFHLLQRAAARAVCGHAEGQQGGIRREDRRGVGLCRAAQQTEREIRPAYRRRLIRYGQILDRLRLFRRLDGITRNDRVQPGISRLCFLRCFRRSGRTAAGAEHHRCQQQADKLFQLHA